MLHGVYPEVGRLITVESWLIVKTPYPFFEVGGGDVSVDKFCLRHFSAIKSFLNCVYASQWAAEVGGLML